MKRMLSIALSATLLWGCGNKAQDAKTDTKKDTPKAAAPNANAPAAKPPPAAAKPIAAKTTKTEKEGAKALPETAKKPVPTDWWWVDREAKGYSFAVPANSSENESIQSKKGFEMYAAYTPEPNNLEVYVVAFKDKSLSKDQLMSEYAPLIIEEGATLNEVAIDPASVVDEGDFRFANGTATFGETKYKLRFLVALDKSDNYIMAVVAEAGEYDKTTETIDAITGSFYMWSGGASGGL